MSSLGRHPDWDSIIIRTFPISYSNMSKNGKNSKNQLYPLQLKNPFYLKSQKSIFNWLGGLRSVRDLEVHKCTRSSDATCCASMAVNTCFFSSGATTSKIWPPEAPKLVTEFISMPSFDSPPHWDSIVIRTPPILSSKCRKPVKLKNPLYIRYNSKIRYI